MKAILEILHNKIFYYKDAIEVKKPLIELAKEIESYIEQNYYEKEFVDYYEKEFVDWKGDKTYCDEEYTVYIEELHQYWKDNIEDK